MFFYALGQSYPCERQWLPVFSSQNAKRKVFQWFHSLCVNWNSFSQYVLQDGIVLFPKSFKLHSYSRISQILMHFYLRQFQSQSDWGFSIQLGRQEWRSTIELEGIVSYLSFFHFTRFSLSFGKCSQVTVHWVSKRSFKMCLLAWTCMSTGVWQNKKTLHNSDPTYEFTYPRLHSAPDLQELEEKEFLV